MPKYVAVFYETTRYEKVIEADNLEQARQKSGDVETDECWQDNDYYEWELMDIVEMKEEGERGDW